jgi:hypothetical protein
VSLRTVALDLATLDTLVVEAYCVFVAEDERPLWGLAGLLDWRMTGALSRLCEQGLLAGDVAESLLTTTNGAVPGPRVFAFGLGPQRALSAASFAPIAKRAGEAVARAAVASVAVGLPEKPAGPEIARLVAEAFRVAAPEVCLVADPAAVAAISAAP